MNKEILRLAVPQVLSNLTVPLLGAVDLALMGHLGNPALIGGVALGALLFQFLYWGFGFLRMGTTGLTAQAFGKKDWNELVQVLGRALLLGLIAAVFLLVLQVPIERAGLFLLSGSAEVEFFTAQYFNIRIWAAPATLMMYALLGWFFGAQNSWIPMLLTIFINLVNLGLNYYFVLVQGMQIEGVAMATVFAQYAGVIVAFAVLFGYYRGYLKNWKSKGLLEISKMIEFLKLNGDIFIRTIMLILSIGFLLDQSARISDMTLAINSVLFQFVLWMSFSVDGFALAGESLVGKYDGAKDPVNLKRVIRLVFIWGFGLATMYSIIYGIGYTEILKLFTNQTELISDAQPFKFWITFMPILGVACYIWDGIFIGFTDSKGMRNTMFVGFAVFLTTIFIALPFLGNHALWLGWSAFLTSRGLAQLWWYSRYQQHHLRV